MFGINGGSHHQQNIHNTKFSEIFGNILNIIPGSQYI